MRRPGRPRVACFTGSYFEGTAGFVLRVADIDRDVERCGWDVTDCQRRSVLPGGLRRRGGFSGVPHVSDVDTAVIVGAFDTGMTDAQLANRCMLVWVADERGNVSEILEIPFAKRRRERSPSALIFNATYLGTTAMRVSLDVVDPDNDYVGVLVVYNTRGGTKAMSGASTTGSSFDEGRAAREHPRAAVRQLQKCAGPPYPSRRITPVLSRAGLPRLVGTNGSLLRNDILLRPRDLVCGAGRSPLSENPDE